ncbi:MAG: LysE family transporter [Desulfobacterales bacterium]
METGPFIKGFLVGFFLCAPLGPIGVLAFKRTLTEGRLAGFFSLLGASTADGIYCALAGLGVHAIPAFLINEKTLFQLFVGVILFMVGIRVWLSRPPSIKRKNKGSFEAFVGMFLLVLANPLPVLIFATLFTALGINGWGADSLLTSCVVAGVFLGSAAWSPILAAGIPFFRFEAAGKDLLYLNRLSGKVIIIFAIIFAFTSILF